MDVLLMDDDPDDVRRVEECLDGGQLSIKLVSCADREEALNEMERNKPDVILVQHRPGTRTAQAFVNECRTREYRTPVIVLSRKLDEKTIREVLRMDVADFRDLQTLSATGLEDSIRFAIRNGSSDSGGGGNTRTDPRTGLLNREAILHRLRGVLKQSTRNDFVSSIALLDVERLCRTNEQPDSPTRERVLRDIGSLVYENIRDSDFAGRYGADQLLIICPHTKLHGTYALGNRITQHIDQKIIGRTDDGPDGTATMGCISFDGSKQETVDQRELKDLRQRVEESAEEARNHDRNTVVGTLHPRMETR